MELLNAAGLWWLAALPLLLLPYLIRERPRRRIVPALFLYRDLEPAKRLRIGGRLRLRPLFLLQLLLLLLVIAALVRPAMPDRTTRSAMVLDDSASLQAIDASGRPRADRLREEAARALTGSTSRLWDVYTLSPGPELLAGGVDRDEAAALIRDFRAGDCADADDATIESFLETLAGKGYADVHVVSDRPGRDVEKATAFRFHDVGAPLANVAIADFTVRRHAFAAERAEAAVTVASHSGSVARVTIAVENAANGEVLAERQVELTPGATQNVTFDIPAARSLAARLAPGDAFAADDAASYAAPDLGGRNILLVARTPEGLDRVPGLSVDVVAPEAYEPGTAAGRDLVVFHRSAPAEPPPAAALYVMPPPSSFLPAERTTVERPELSLPEPTHPAVRYIQAGLLRPRHSFTFAVPSGWDPLVVATKGPVLLARKGELAAAIVGFDLLPFLGERNRPVSILTLNLISFLSGMSREAGSCKLLGTSESELRSRPPIPLPAVHAAPPGEVPITVSTWRAIAVAALVLLAIEWLLQARSGFPRAAPLVLRLVAASLLLAAAFDPHHARPGEAFRPRLVVDQSGSVLPQTRSRILEGLDAFPVESTTVFGNAEATDLEAALSANTTEAPRGGALLLVTDGWETAGDARRAIPWLRSRGIRVYPFAVEQKLGGNVEVARISVPPEARPGRAVRAAVWIRNDNPAEVRGRLTIRRGREIVSREDVTLAPGENVFARPVLVTGTGLVELSAELETAAAGRNHATGDDSAKAWIAIRGRRQVLLVGADGGRYLKAALERRGYVVETRPAGASLPDLSETRVVILNDVALRDLPPNAASTIRAFVSGGGGLVMVGGPRSFGLGGYAGSPIEEVLPVRMKPREREEPRTAIALIIDKSGSMREEQRMAYAKDAARELVAQMNDRDRLTVIGFDREAFTVVPLREVGDLREDFERRIGRLRAIGGTRLYPALIAARRELLGQEARRRHMIVLSDGLSEDAETAAGQRAYYDLALALNDSGITISTIALGREADARFLERLASFGRGAFHRTDDPSNLPELVIGGLEERGPEKTLREERIPASPSRDSALIAEIVRSAPRWPSVLGLVETELKRGARLDVAAPDSTPLIASWEFAAGRAVAFTTDASGRWSDRWIRWPQWSPLWGSIVGWLAPEGEETEASYALAWRDGALVLDYTRFDEDPAGALTASLVGPGDVRGEARLERTAPGHFRASFPTRTAGDYRIDVRGPRGSLTRPPLGFTIAREAVRERPRERPNWDLLEELALATGGKLAPARDAIELPPPPLEKLPLAPWFLPAVIFLFVGELVLRRFRGQNM